ncbi:MAG: WD40 repeat domain-containing serine/threonine protein kinase [Isosphaerales bacterium]
MGEVYEAVEEPLARRVAVKTIRRSQATSASLLLRFDRERRTLARLHHTNVVPIFATGCEGDLLYFAMPYLSGASLGQVIKTARSHESSGNGLASSSFEELLQEAQSRSSSASADPEVPGDEQPRPVTLGVTEPVAKGLPEGPSSSTRGPGVQLLSKSYIRTVVQVMAAVAEGIHHAHEAGVIHRDLKPSNIMVETSGHAWVLDFGLAALKATSGAAPVAFAFTPSGAEPDASLTAGPVGTPPYMAPEQHGGGKQADAHSDVWGVGVTLYELLTLQRAFATGKAVLDTDPPPPLQLNPALDRDLEAVVLKTMRKDPAQRYSTAQALADDLKHWLRREPVSARPAAIPRRLMLWSRRSPGWAAASLIMTLAMLGAGVGGTEYYRMQAQARERQLQLLDIQRIAQSDHFQGWSKKIRDRISGLTWKPEERGAVQAQAAASLSGFDTSLEKEHRIFAQSLAFAPEGRLWMGHTGDGPRRWNPETDRLETWPLELSGPLAIRPDGSPWQIGPTFTEPDRPDRLPLDPRPNPYFPLQLLDVERQKIIRTLSDPVEGGSRLLAWTLAPEGSRAAATVLDPKGEQLLLIWDADSGKLLHRRSCRIAPDSPALPRPGLAFSPDAGLLAIWDGSGWVDLWSVSDGQTAASFRVQNAIHCVAFGQNQWYTEAPRTTAERWMIAVGGTDGLITLWNPASRGTWQLLRAPGLEILTLAFSEDGTLLASAGHSGPGCLWDVATGQRLVEFHTQHYTMALAFSPDGTRLASSY